MVACFVALGAGLPIALDQKAERQRAEEFRKLWYGGGTCISYLTNEKGENTNPTPC